MGYLLSKIGKREYMENLLNDGSVYMNQLNYFKKLEDNKDNTVIGDSNDGLMAYYSGDNPTLTCEIKSDTTFFSCHPKEIKISGRFDECAIYCMYGINESLYQKTFDINLWANKIDQNIFEFGNTMIIITNSPLFREKIYKAALNMGHELDSKPIEYMPNDYCGEMGPFKKFEKYKYQSEIRFITKTLTNGPLQLKLGSLKDISMMIDLDRMEVLHH